MSSLREFWSRLDRSSHLGDAPIFVHPDDAKIFEKCEHSFNLYFPPPAFLGDIERAPVIVLMANGGYKQDLTEKEFNTEESIQIYLEYLTSKTSKLPPKLSEYYRRHWGDWIENGWVALVNAVPYRSKRLSQEPDNRRVAKKLTSLRIHKEWLNNEILPQARGGQRLVIAHRYSWWGLSAKTPLLPPTVLLSDATKGEPNRSKPDAWKMSFAEDWLYSRGLGPKQNEDTFRRAAECFGERFSRWGIVIPLAHIRTRQPGLIKKEGWHIQYCFEYDDHTGAIDYVADHRMAGTSHVRIHMDGTCTPLPAPEILLEVTENPVKNSEIQAEFYHRNREIGEFLSRKFGVSK